jgi:hypothetical protein
MDILLTALVTAGLVIGIFLFGLMSGRNRASRDELEEWEGVMDVKRETRDKLKSDPDYVERMQNQFNNK